MAIATSTIVSSEVDLAMTAPARPDDRHRGACWLLLPIVRELSFLLLFVYILSVHTRREYLIRPDNRSKAPQIGIDSAER